VTRAGTRERVTVHWLPLAHRSREHADGCLHLPLGRFRLAICSRCVGLYTILAPALLLQLHFRVGRTSADWWIALPGALVALLDWGTSHLGRPSSNATRIATGAALGIALSRSFVLYFRDPLSLVFWLQAALLVSGTLAFELVRRLR